MKIRVLLFYLDPRKCNKDNPDPSLLFGASRIIRRQSDSCFLVPLLAPPRHWRELKKVAHVAVALKQKNDAVAVAGN